MLCIMTRMTAERFFGGKDHRIENLHSTLRFVSRQTPTEHELTNWLLENTSAGSESTISKNISFLESIDLLEHTPEATSQRTRARPSGDTTNRS